MAKQTEGAMKPDKLCPSCQAIDNNPYVDARGVQMRACGRCMIQWEDADYRKSAPEPSATNPLVAQYAQRVRCGNCNHVHIGLCHCGCKQLVPPSATNAREPELLCLAHDILVAIDYKGNFGLAKDLMARLLIGPVKYIELSSLCRITGKCHRQTEYERQIEKREAK